MGSIKKIYLNFYVLVYALYAFLNKGIAYSYLSEVLLITGLVLIICDRRRYEFVWDRSVLVLGILILVTAIYIYIGITRYAIVDVIRDSLAVNYAFFVFIIFFLKDELPALLKKIGTIYQWYPLVMFVLFLLTAFVPSLVDIRLFGNISLLQNKPGDMALHLAISVLMLITGQIELPKRYLIINLLMIAYLVMAISSYGRAAMLSFVLSMVVFFVYCPDKSLKQKFKGYLKISFVAVLFALPIFMLTNFGENFQGRTMSIGQLKENVVSIFVEGDKGSSLNDNKAWRLVWWGKIIDYTIMGEYFWMGKGLGMSLAIDDEIYDESDESGLRSPHNFHLTILARFGVPVFLIWLYWLFLYFKRIRVPRQDVFIVFILSVSFGYIVNASFDVFLEGPMGAFPFWTFVGLMYVKEAEGEKTLGKHQIEVSGKLNSSGLNC
jgi:hypothetical protein